MLLVVEKKNIDGLCHSINRYVKASSKYMKHYDKNEKPSYLKYWNIGWQCHKNCK